MMAAQMLRPSFVPPKPIRQLRDLTRYRVDQVGARTAETVTLNPAAWSETKDTAHGRTHVTVIFGLELFYRVGYTPWDGHPSMLGFAAWSRAPPQLHHWRPPADLDLGCGTGDTALYLAQHRWRVTGVDFAGHAIQTARREAAAQHVAVTFVQADVTLLTDGAIGSHLALIVDTGCLHTLPHEHRRGHVGELTARAAPGALLFIVGYPPHPQRSALGITDEELTGRLAPAEWTPVATIASDVDTVGRDPLRAYLFERRSTSRPMFGDGLQPVRIVLLACSFP